MTDARSDSLPWISGAREAAHALLDEEAADLAVVRARPHDGHVGDRAVRDPHLRAVEDPVGAVAARRACASIPGSEPASDSVRPKQPIASPGVHRRQPALLLLLRAPAPDGEHRQRALDRARAADARVARLQLEARQAVRDRARPGQAVAVEVHAEQPELRELGVDLPRQHALLEPLPDLGQHALADELAHGVADRALLVESSASMARKSRGSSVGGAEVFVATE